ncbi:MAG: hypothetical protein QM568_10205 [Microbacterium sp.]
MPVPPLPRAADPAPLSPPPVTGAADGSALLTRRQMREQERARTASVPVLDTADAAPEGERATIAVDETDAVPAVVEEAPVDVVDADAVVEADAVPDADAVADAVAVPEADAVPSGADEDDDLDEEVDVVPVSAAVTDDAVGEAVLVDDEAAQGAAADALGLQRADESGEGAEDGAADAETERPVVSDVFGQSVLADQASARAFVPSFDDLLLADGSGGSQHSATSALIFNPPAGERSLDGPVASTGEILVTGSYELPSGIGSQGHAHGVADGKDVDAILIDGELPPASSPTPIAASAAISTIKPAGEVIRPPAPEKGNKLMLTLAIVAGGLALALGVVLIIAFTTKLI